MNQIDILNYFLETIGDHSYLDPDKCDKFQFHLPSLTIDYLVMASYS